MAAQRLFLVCVGPTEKVGQLSNPEPIQILDLGCELATAAVAPRAVITTLLEGHAASYWVEPAQGTRPPMT